jgi:CBS domain-containing protein
MKTIQDVMSRKVVKIQSVTMLPEAAQTMRQENIGVLPVEDNGQLVGVVTDRDITVNAVSQGNVNCQVKEVMTLNPISIGPSANPEEAIELMLKHGVRRLPVVDGQHLVGVVSFEDLVEAGNDQQILSALRTFHQHTKHG